MGKTHRLILEQVAQQLATTPPERTTMKTHIVSAGLLLAALVACGQAAAVGSTASNAASSAATSLHDASVGGNANALAFQHGNPNTLGLEHILPMLHAVPREAMAGLHGDCDPNAVHAQVNACGENLPGSAQATWSSCALGFGHGGPGHPSAGNANSAGGPPFHRHFGGVSSGQLTVTASVTPDANAACNAGTVIAAARQAQFSVRMSDPNDPNRPIMQVSGNNQETLSQIFGSNNQNITLTLDMNRTLSSSTGTVLHQGSLSGTVHIQETRPSDHTPPARTVDGTLSVSGDTVVLTGVQVGNPHACAWPSAGSVQRTGSDGVAHTLVFGSTCGSATLDGASVTLPNPPHHGGFGHGHGQGHDHGPPPQTP